MRVASGAPRGMGERAWRGRREKELFESGRAAAAVNTGAANAPRATEICESNFDAVTFRNAADRLDSRPLSRRLAFVHRKKGGRA